ncbi:MAG: hypothetical protein DRP65_04150 [Planctomycetota bacterium]|nr:MAG: hypothetical protein DRP65_04150 [Planctomycetota bacterium]
MDSESAIITPENKPFVLTRFLPKTGQTIIYAPNDDGDYQKGWAIGGRFVVKTISGDDVVFDRSTGLLWPKDGSKAGCNNGNMLTWANAIIYCEGLSFAGYSDWRLPNIYELQSIVEHNGVAPFLYSAWVNMVSSIYWSSTTYMANTTAAWCTNFIAGLKNAKTKTENWYLIAVRGGSPW